MPRFCIVSHSNQGILQALAKILVPRAHDPFGWWLGSKTSRDAILAQNFRLTEVAACVIHELFECVIYTMRHFCVSCMWELVHSAKWC